MDGREPELPPGNMHAGVETWDTECGCGSSHWTWWGPLGPEERGYGAPEDDGSGAGKSTGP
ncbi:MAG: hypothetical protein ACF8Q5_04610 [Phycisphaerales bacterium JB040]